MRLFALLCAEGSTPFARAGYDAGDYVASKGVGKIVFSSNSDGKWEIYIMRADGTGKARLTKSEENDTMPCLSSDGSRVLWVAGGEGTGPQEGEYGGRICIMDLKDLRKKYLTPQGKLDDNPQFSTDGKKIIFSSVEEDSDDIWTMNTDGSSRKRLTTDSASDCMPSSSPNGRQIVFQSNRTGAYEIFVMDADGKNLKQLTKYKTWAGAPSFSPDGKNIVFASSGNDKSVGAWIFLMNANGANPRKISHGDFYNSYPGFSPDGKSLVSASDRDDSEGNNIDDIYTMDLNGKNLKRLTKDKAYETQPDWK